MELSLLKVFTVVGWWGFGSEVEEWGLVLCWWLRHSPLALCLFIGTIVSHARVTSEACGAVGESQICNVEISLWSWGAQAEQKQFSSTLAWRWPCGQQWLATAQGIVPRDPGKYYSIPLGFLKSISMTKCTHLTQPLCSRINLLTCMELLLLAPTDGGGAELPKDLGEGYREGNHTWHS